MEVSQRITHMHLKTKAEQIACHHIGFLAAPGRFVGPGAASVDVADILPIKSGDCNQVCVASSQDTHTQPLRLDSRAGSSHSGREEPSRERTEEA